MHNDTVNFVWKVISTIQVLMLTTHKFFDLICIFSKLKTFPRLMCFQLIAIVMDVFTDGDIFKELINATQRGVVVYILLDDSHVKSFLKMAHDMEINIQELKVRNTAP